MDSGDAEDHELGGEALPRQEPESKPTKSKTVKKPSLKRKPTKDKEKLRKRKIPRRRLPGKRNPQVPQINPGRNQDPNLGIDPGVLQDKTRKRNQLLPDRDLHQRPQLHRQTHQMMT